MDSSVLGWVAVGAGVVLIVVLVVLQQLQKRPPKPGKLRETEMVAMVRRRRELNSQLADLAGDQSRVLLQAEARRQGGSVSDIAVLEAAIARAERMSDRQALSAETPAR